MYAALWRLLPGNRWSKTACAVLLAAAVVALCFSWVFPTVAEWMAVDEGRVG